MLDAGQVRGGERELESSSRETYREREVKRVVEREVEKSASVGPTCKLIIPL